MPIHDIQKVPSKNIIFWAFCRQNKGFFPYMGICISPITLSNNSPITLLHFGPIPKFFIQGCSGDDYLPDKLLFGWVGCVETPKLRQKFPLWVGLFDKPYLQTEFSKNDCSKTLKCER